MDRGVGVGRGRLDVVRRLKAAWVRIRIGAAAAAPKRSVMVDFVRDGGRPGCELKGETEY